MPSVEAALGAGRWALKGTRRTSRVAETVAHAIQVLIVALITIWIAHWVSDRIWRAARAGQTYVEVGALISHRQGVPAQPVGREWIIWGGSGEQWRALVTAVGRMLGRGPHPVEP